MRPTRGAFLLTGGVELSQWDQFPGEGTKPSVDEVYSPADLTGLGAKVTYLQTQGTVGFDWRRPGAGYARSGGYYGVTLRHFADQDDVYTFDRVDYEAIQHIPILRDAWVLSLRGRVETTMREDSNEVPFFMLPGLGSGSTLRGYQNLRFRDRHSLLMQAEWRVLVNSFIDTAIFFDAGKVAARKSDLDLNDLHTDFGIGFRLHGPLATPLRIEFAKGQRRLQPRLRRERQLLRSRMMPRRPLISSAPDSQRDRRAVVVGAVMVGTYAAARTAAPRFYLRRPASAGTGERGRVQSRAARHQPVLRPRLPAVRHCRPDSRSNTRAANINTIDEVPDSSWFTNRIGSRAMSADELVRGPIDRTATGVAEVDADAREDAPVRRPASPRRTPTARPGSCPSIRQG